MTEDDQAQKAKDLLSKKVDVAPTIFFLSCAPCAQLTGQEISRTAPALDVTILSDRIRRREIDVRCEGRRGSKD